MAKTKAEFQADAEQYRNSLEQVPKAHKDGQSLQAVEAAIAAWDYVDGIGDVVCASRRAGEWEKPIPLDSIALPFYLEQANVRLVRSVLGDLDECGRRSQLLLSLEKRSKATPKNQGVRLEVRCSIQLSYERFRDLRRFYCAIVTRYIHAFP